MAETQETPAAPLADQVKEQTQQAVQQGQQYVGQAAGLVSTKLKTALAEQKDSLATSITDAAQLLKQNGGSFRSQGLGVFAAPYLDQAADKLTEVGTTIQQKRSYPRHGKFRAYPAGLLFSGCRGDWLRRRPVSKKLQRTGRITRHSEGKA